MKHRTPLFLASLTIAALTSFSLTTTAPTEAYAENVIDYSLPPLVMIVYDTSGSMDAIVEQQSGADPTFYCESTAGANDYKNRTARYTTHLKLCRNLTNCEDNDPQDCFDTDTRFNKIATQTRHTKALAEIAGTPKLPPGVSKGGIIRAKEAVFPRKKLVCNDNSCEYVTTAFYTGSSYSVNNLYASEDCPTNLRKYNPTTGKFVTQLRENCTLAGYENAYIDDGILQAYKYSVKFGLTGMTSNIACNKVSTMSELTTLKHMYGYATIEDHGINYGRDIKNYYYKTCIDDTNYRGSMQTHNPAAASPLIYPTVSDDQEDIAMSNERVISGIRSYYMYTSTPIGGVLADLYFMFGGDSEDFSSADEGMYKQHLRNQNDIDVDTSYACRPKAVLLITDGGPNQSPYTGTDTNGHGYYTAVWNDARHLSRHNIKVYSIGYAYAAGDPNKSGVAKTMNWIAWKGGTCKDPVTGNLIDPDDEPSYNAMVTRNKPGTTTPDIPKRTCFYNAMDNTALRNALVTALSDMLQGTVSKTRIATTNAISMKNNIVNGKYNNGYYSIYSGFDITLGHIRLSRLQRATTTCNHGNGEFESDSSQFMDMAQRLACRITGCTNSELLEKAGYTSAPTPCALHGSQSAHPVSGNTNTCLQNRYIFAGDYSTNRYAINPHPTNLLKKNENDEYVAGLIKNARGVNEDASFLTKKAGVDDACQNEKDKYIFVNVSTSANYALSPYECGNDLDCGVQDGIPGHCDLGRCVTANNYNALTESCSENEFSDFGPGSPVPEKACIAGRKRTISSGCLKHSECGEGEVCHAGTCLTGTVFNCDIRQFMATQRLGTIEYATPTPVNPPTRSYPSAKYKIFANKYWQRDTMLLVGANDGMLHNFILGDNTKPGATDGSGGYKRGLYKTSLDIMPTNTWRDFDEGDELWAFIPKTIMPKLQGLTNYGLQSLLNTTPVVADVMTPELYRYPDGTLADTQWRTVVVGGFREGGRGYYALDITNPGQPKILWEIDHQWQAKSSPEYPDMLDTNAYVTINEDAANRISQDYPFQLMGYSFAEPVITNVVIHKTVGGVSTDVIEPVAILAGGNNLWPENPQPNRVGKALYIVRLFPKDPSELLVKAFYFESEITGTPAVFPSNFNAIAQHIYVGDSNSALFRLDVSTYPKADGSYHSVEQWGSLNKRILNEQEVFEEPIFEPSRLSAMGGDPTIDSHYPWPSQYDKITYKPAVSLYSQNSAKPTIQITYATGSNDNFNISSSDHNFAAYFYDVYTSNGHYELNPPELADGGKDIPLVIVFNPPSKPPYVVEQKPANSPASEGGMKFAIYTKDPMDTSLNIEPRQKATGAPITYNYVSYFPTYEAVNSEGQGQCVTGNAAIWKIGDIPGHERTSRSFGLASNVQNIVDNSAFTGSKISLDNGTKVYGLEITNQMYCSKDSAPSDGKVAAPQLVAQTGFTSSTLMNDTGSLKLKSGKTEINNIAINMNALVPSPKRLSWASVYE